MEVGSFSSDSLPGVGEADGSGMVSGDAEEEKVEESRAKKESRRKPDLERLASAAAEERLMEAGRVPAPEAEETLGCE